MSGTLLRWLVDPSGLTPHGFCLLWEPGLIWLHALSDIGIGVAYFAIPFVLVAIIRLRPDLGFTRLFGLFAAFILLCGTGHWLDLLTLWIPAYGLEGIVKALTAITSIVTAIVLLRLIPQALTWPTPTQLAQVNSKLAEVQQAELRLALTAKGVADDRDRLAEELKRRVMAEAALRESEERDRLLLGSDVTEALSLLDAFGNIESWNSRSERIHGYTSAEIMGTNFARFFTSDENASCEPARLLKEASDTGYCATKGWRVRKDGTRFLAKVALNAIRRDDGTLRGFACLALDITHEQAEEEQRSIMIEAAPNGMMIVDEAGVITLINSQAERIFGYPRSALLGQPVEVLVPEHLRLSHGVLRSRFTTGVSNQAMSPLRQFPGRRKDGTSVSIEIMLNPVKTSRGSIVVASLFDITERLRLAALESEAAERERVAMLETNARLDHLSRNLERARDTAEQSNRAKSRFLAGMSHELRTPLNGILGYATLLRMDGGLNGVQAARVEAMQGAGTHLLEMIHCVLDLSEIETERVELRMSSVELRGVIIACLDLVRPMAEGKALSLHLKIEPDVPTHIVIDVTRLRQVLLNILGNAVKFTTQGSVRLQITTVGDGDGLRFAVADTGPGVPPEQVARLFEEFERLGSEATKGSEGAGLGLSLSSRLAARMGGRMGYEENPSGGSVFWVELPLVASNEAATLVDIAEAAVPIDTLAAGVSGRVLNILVVDDLAMNCDIAAAFIRSTGHRVTCVESGAEAIDAAAATDFDVIFMDVRMPEMDGLEATRRLRKLQAPRGQVPIVALTAQVFTEQVVECRMAGMDSHVIKPFTLESLAQGIAEGLVAGQRRGWTLASV